jgi:hypothetical protein
MGMVETLRSLIADELVRRSEPWGRKFLDLATGAPYDDVVATLAQVGVGLERDSVGSPLSDEAFREQLVAWLVDTILVDPNLPKNMHRPQLQTGVRVQFETRGEPEPGVRVLDTLAELALGASEETQPRAARIAAPDRVVAAYLRGAEAVPVETVAAAVAPPPPVAARPRAAKPRPAAVRRRAGVKVAAKRAKPAAARRRTKRRPAAKTTARGSKPVARKRSATKKAAAKASQKKRARTKSSTGPRRRGTAMAKARRKKK